MEEIKAGDIKWFHEEGEVIEVEVLDVDEDLEGEAFELKATGKSKSRSRYCKSIEKDEVFSVWRAHGYESYAGWHLLDK